MSSASVQVSRRSVLASVAGITLLSGCGASGQSKRPTLAHSPPAASPTVGGDSHPTELPAPTPGGPIPSDRPGEPEHYVHDGTMGIALTIDDGPDPRYTAQILSLLAEHRITATFCMIGQSAQRFPQLVRDVHAHGHHIANHTWTHPDLARLSPIAVEQEMLRAEDAIVTATGGYRPTLFRAPFGAWSTATLATCTKMRLRPLDWSVDPKDWSRPGTNRIVDTVLRTTRPGSIILEHDGGGDRSQTLAALRVFLPRLLDQGYHFVTP